VFFDEVFGEKSLKDEDVVFCEIPKKEVIVNSNQAKNIQVVFLRAYQRSGTNWMGNLLNLHPDIVCKGEFHFKSFFDSYLREPLRDIAIMLLFV